MNFESGKLVIFSAPSGSGKTTLVRHLLNLNIPLEFSISATSRNPRHNEVDGRDYYFLSAQEFQNRIDRGEFLEWEEVYEGCFYGTLRKEVERIWSLGKHVVFDMDVIGGLNLKKQFGKRALAVFVQPPDIPTLEQRLRERATETEEKILQRLSKARKELAKAQDFDEIILNGDLSVAKAKSERLVKNFLQISE